MEFTELAKLLKKQNESGNGFLIHLNADDLEEKSHRNTSVEFGDLHFTKCQSVRNGEMLVFDNSNREPVDHKEDGTPLYTLDSDSSMYIDITKIEAVEEEEDGMDWFLIPTKQVIHLYMYSENNRVDGNRNVITIGFMDQQRSE